MAQTPTLYDFDIELNHVDRQIHQSLTLRTSRHPSETLERVWLRVLAYCWLYEERIAFGPGLCDPEAPDLLARDLTSRITLWVRVGRPDPVKLQQEADRAGDARIAALFESPRRLESFLDAARQAGIARLGRATLAAVDPNLLAALAAVDARRTKLSFTVVEDHLYLERAGQTLEAPLVRGALA